MTVEIRADGLVVEGRGGQGRVDPGDPHAILRHMGDPVRIARGLSAAALFKALLPWSAVLSEMGRLDFPLWERALCRGHLREASAPAPRGAGMTGLSIRPEATFLRAGAADELQVAWVTVALDADDPGTAYAVPGDVAAWSRLPVALASDAKVMGATLSRPMTVTPTFYDAIVIGFLDDVTYGGSPEESAQGDEEVARMVEELGLATGREG